MKHAVHMGVAALALSFAGAALAADNSTMKPAAPATSGSSFTTLDANKDGRLSQAEVRANADLNGRFAILDADADTYLSQLEYGKWESTSQSSVPGTGNRTPMNEPARPVSPSDPSSSSSSGIDNGAAGKSPQ